MTRNLISSASSLENTLRLNSKARRKQKRFEKQCQKHFDLLHKHLAGANAGHHAITSKSLRADAKSLQALLSVAQSYLQDLEEIQEPQAAEAGSGTALGLASTVVSNSEQDNGCNPPHSTSSRLSLEHGYAMLALTPNARPLNAPGQIAAVSDNTQNRVSGGMKQSSFPTGETVQHKWANISHKPSAGASTAVPIPAPGPRTPDSGPGRRRTYFAPGPKAPESFTSYAPCPSTHNRNEAEGQKDNETLPTSTKKKQRRRSYAKWIGKSTTPIPCPILPTLTPTQKMKSTTPIPPPTVPLFSTRNTQTGPPGPVAPATLNGPSK
ncbi:hypothetical protein PG995_001294 [Apiospora arundinis]